MANVPTVGQTAYPQKEGFDGYIGNILIRLAVSKTDPFETMTADAAAQRIDTSDSAEDIRDEAGTRYSRSNLSGGAGMDFLHSPRRPDDSEIRYWDSAGVDVFAADKGSVYAATLLHEMALDESASAIKRAVQIDGTVYYVNGTGIYQWVSTGVVLKATLSAAAVDMVAMGNSLYTLDGTSGVQRYDPPSWTPTNVSATTTFTRIWGVKGRIVGVIDNLLYEVAPVVADVNEIQHVEHDATSGTFYLSYKDGHTSDLAYNISLANLETAIEGLPGITAVTVGGTTGAWTVTFTDPGAENIDTMGWNDDSLVAGTMTVHTETQGVTGSISTLLLTLTPEDTITDVVDTGTAVLVFTTTGTIYTMTISDTLVMSVTGQSSFIDEIPVMAAYVSGVIGICTAEQTASAGRIARFYTAAINTNYDVVDLQLIWQLGDRDTTDDLTPTAIEATRDSIYVSVPNEDLETATLWRYYLPTGGYARSLELGGPVRYDVLSLTETNNRMWAAVDGEGLWMEQETYVPFGYIVGPLADFYTAELKQWVTAEITGTAPYTTEIVLYDSNDQAIITNPLSTSWQYIVRVIASSPATRNVDMVSKSGRYHLAKVELRSDTAGTYTPRLQSYSFRAMPSPTRDQLFRIPINISDQVEAPGYRAITVPGRGEAVRDALMAYEGVDTLIETWRPPRKIQGIVEKFEEPIYTIPTRGSVGRVMYARIRGKRLSTAGWTATPTLGSSLGQDTLGLSTLGVGDPT